MKSKINLFLFDGGEAPAAAENGSPESGNSGEYSEVGTQTDAVEDNYGREPDEEQGEPSDEGSYKQFKNRFKDEIQADMQRVINKRFKNSKKVEAQRDELRDKNEKYQSLVGILANRYETDDVDALIEKVSQEKSYFENKALENGTSVEEEMQKEADRRHQKQIEAELESYKTDKQQREEQQLREEIVADWERQGQELLKIYPSFNLDEEANNEKFVMALQTGLFSVRDAYQFAHFDEILSGTIQYAAEKIKNGKLDAAEARRNRVSENGTKSHAPAVVKNDISKLSRQEMEDIDRRVLRGERIVL